MAYIIKTSRQFEKDFAKLDSLTQSKTLVILEQMKQKPLFNVTKLKGIKIGIYRRRIGDYRLRFDIINNSLYLYCLRHRKEVYRWFSSPAFSANWTVYR